jgi:hypothetical protein
LHGPCATPRRREWLSSLKGPRIAGDAKQISSSLTDQKSVCPASAMPVPVLRGPRTTASKKLCARNSIVTWFESTLSAIYFRNNLKLFKYLARAPACPIACPSASVRSDTRNPDGCYDHSKHAFFGTAG